MGLLMSVVSHELLEMPGARWKLLIRPLTVAGIIILIFINIYIYTDTLKHRTYAIRDTNEYLSHQLKKEDIVLGAWAPSLTWDSKSKALPVWNNFLNYKDPVTNFKPRVIIAETDEQDSEQAWSSQGINLKDLADSVKTVRISQWEMRIYWLKPGI
jgi:hypothetical protein